MDGTMDISDYVNSILDVYLGGLRLLLSTQMDSSETADAHMRENQVLNWILKLQ